MIAPRPRAARSSCSPRREGAAAADSRLAAAVGVLAVGLAAAWAIAHGLAKETAPAPSFKRLTFRQRPIGTARFAHDGQTIVYSMDSSAGPQLYMTRPQSPESTLLPFSGDLLSISRSGGSSLILQSRRPVGRGVLATVPMAGGAPRQVLTEVSYEGADWSPDGKSLVVIHVADDKLRMESPIGKVLAFGEFGSPRFSTDGGMISFWEASGRSISVGVIDQRLGKAKRTLSSGWTEILGLPCWAASGREIWFTAGKGGEKPALWRVDLLGEAPPGDSRAGKPRARRHLRRWPRPAHARYGLAERSRARARTVGGDVLLLAGRPDARRPLPGRLDAAPERGG